jgi:hypothetical protein
VERDAYYEEAKAGFLQFLADAEKQNHQINIDQDGKIAVMVIVKED